MKNNKDCIAVKIVSPSATLKAIQVGETKLVKNRDIRDAIVRSTVSRLNKSGYGFRTHTTPDGLEVTRYK